MILCWSVARQLAIPLLAMFAVIGAGTIAERLAPAEEQRLDAIPLNAGMGVFANALRLALAPALGLFTTVLIGEAGGGWIALPDRGWALAGSIVAYLLVIDFSEFLFHRAQHAIPWLWAMHSFHHSDRAVNVSTALRNFWLETPLKILFVYPWVAVIFRAPAAVLAAYTLSTVWHSVNHLNLRWRSPIPWFVLNNWQYHRIHHSVLPKHWDTNFAPYFPIWDVLCGTAYPPARGEFPQTGLPEIAEPVRFAEAMVWPWRRRFNGNKERGLPEPEPV